jgi:hypothetical protein
VQVLGSKYRVLENEDIDIQFRSFVEALEPVWRALIREALHLKGRLAEYRQWKARLTAQLSPDAHWRREYWQLPVALVLALVRHALEELVLDGLDLGRVSSVLAEDAAGVTDVVAAARQIGLSVDHDEAAALQGSAECMRNVYRECARYLVALYGVGGAHTWQGYPQVSSISTALKNY